MSRTIILTNQQINHKIRRIAFQVYENNIDEKEIILAGIKNKGFILAKKLKKTLESISDIKVQLCEVKVNKRSPLDQIETSQLVLMIIKTNHWSLVDDVLNSGSTLIYATRHFLEVPLKQFKTVVLVNRNHKKYPNQSRL